MPGKNFNLDSKGSSRSVNNRSPKVTYYGANAAVFTTGPNTSGVAANVPLPGTGVITKNRSITERIVENFSSRALNGIGSTYQIGQNRTVPEFEITTTGGGVQLAVSTGSSSTLGAGSSSSEAPISLPPGNPNEYDWNLPPHKWSLPLAASIVNEQHYVKNKVSPKSPSSDKYRRGRLWWKANPPISTVDANGNVSALSVGDANRKYGFQFLWNPETVGTQVAVQLEATPSVQDRFLGVTGAFPATQTVSFVIRLDRTNDFACASTLFPNLDDIVRRDSAALNVLLPRDVEDFKKFYKPANSFAVADSSEKMNKKLIDLFQRGTIADIEYLYKTINGPGPSGAEGNEWMNGRGIKTADIGWLMPTLLHVDIGPLSYDGYVTALQVNHTAFTPNMTPIRSELTISLNVMATASITTAEVTSTSSTWVDPARNRARRRTRPRS